MLLTNALCPCSCACLPAISFNFSLTKPRSCCDLNTHTFLLGHCRIRMLGLNDGRSLNRALRAMSHFQHETLDGGKGSIRLLSKLPDPPDEGHVQCTILHHKSKRSTTAFRADGVMLNQSMAFYSTVSHSTSDRTHSTTLLL